MTQVVEGVNEPASEFVPVPAIGYPVAPGYLVRKCFHAIFPTRVEEAIV
ncbi:MULTISPECIES: hypothetical protein [Mycolicibacter]|nr:MULTISPECIES: hypothetical protein [Mycolicibacter]